MKRTSDKLFPAVFLIGLIVFAVIGTMTVDAADIKPGENSGDGSVVNDTQVTINTKSLPDGAVGSVYSQELQATGGITPYTWRIVFGSLPAGLIITDTGLIYGTPTIAGISNFRVRVTDSQNPTVTFSKTFSIAVGPPVLAIFSASLSDGTVREKYSQRLQATGGFFPYKWNVSGSLPAGLSLNAITGEISGLPTADGTSKFTVLVIDSQNPSVTVRKELSINIKPSFIPEKKVIY